MLGPARRLRCAQCGAEWQPRAKAVEPADVVAPPPQSPPAELVAREAAPTKVEAESAPARSAPPPARKAVKPPPPEPEPKQAEPETATLGELRERVAKAEEPPPPPRRFRAALLAAAWVGTFAILTAGGWSAYAYRDKIIQAWPPSQRAYAALGLGQE
jgi:hypothetical protein